MQQTNAPDASGLVSVRTSSVPFRQPELRAKTDITSQNNSNDTNSFATHFRLWMQSTNAPDQSASVSVRISAAALEPE
eukprot:3966299-Pyramimonas_sp.AAC.1